MKVNGSSGHRVDHGWGTPGEVPAVLVKHDWIPEEDHRAPDPWWYRVLVLAALVVTAAMAVAVGALMAWAVMP